MNPVSAYRPSVNYMLEYDHSEALDRVISTVTLLDPVKMAIGYLIPWVAAWISNHTELRREDPAQERLLNSEAKDAIFQLVDDLKAAAGIEREITLYTSLKYNCSSYGGSCSLSSPVLSIPLFFLTKKGDAPFDGIAVQDPTLEPAPYWTFTSDEITFFIAREIAYIKWNDSLCQMISKIFFLSAIFFFFALPVSILTGSLLILSAGIFYIFTERLLHAKLDVEAIEILTKYFDEDQARAIEAGVNALQKLIDQNIERKERKNCLSAFYLTRSGNNFLDLDHPFLTTRLQRVREAFPPPAE